MPEQADEANPFVLTRGRIRDELENNPALRRTFDANTTAEVGADPAKRRWYQATVIDRAVASGKPLSEVVNSPKYYPASTTGATKTTNQGVDESLWGGVLTRPTTRPAIPASTETPAAGLDSRWPADHDLRFRHRD